MLTEGHTEQAYFSRISEILGDADDWKYAVTVDVREIVEGSKTDPVNMVKEAKKSRQTYDQVWVVFDKDRNRDHQNLQAIELANKANIKVAFSSIAFEEWVLLHFEKNTTTFERSDCESRGQPCTCNGNVCVSTYLKLHHYPNYVKGKAKLYDELSNFVHNALENAAWLRFNYPTTTQFHLLNPYTDVDKLVSYLLELPNISYAKTASTFILDDISFCITHTLRTENTITISLQTTNNSNKPFIFNNFQQNIKLINENNHHSPYYYTIPQAAVINQQENKTVAIQFNIPSPLGSLTLIFQTDNEFVYVEL